MTINDSGLTKFEGIISVSHLSLVPIQRGDWVAFPVTLFVTLTNEKNVWIVWQIIPKELLYLPL